MLTDTIVGKIKQLPETVKSEVLTLAGLTASLNVTLTAADGAPDPGVNAETVGPKLSKVYVTLAVPLPKFPTLSLMPALLTVKRAYCPCAHAAPENAMVTTAALTELMLAVGSVVQVPDTDVSAAVTLIGSRASENVTLTEKGIDKTVDVAGLNDKIVAAVVSDVYVTVCVPDPEFPKVSLKLEPEIFRTRVDPCAHVAAVSAKLTTAPDTLATLAVGRLPHVPLTDKSLATTEAA